MQQENDTYSSGIDKPDIAAGTFLESWHPAIRWTLFIPAAILASFVASALILVMHGQYVEPGTFSYSFMELFRSYIFSIAFVGVGSFVAPRKQFAVALGLMTVMTLFLGMSLMLSIAGYGDGPLWYQTLHILVAVGAMGYLVNFVHEKVNNS